MIEQGGMLVLGHAKSQWFKCIRYDHHLDTIQWKDKKCKKVFKKI